MRRTGALTPSSGEKIVGYYQNGDYLKKKPRLEHWGLLYVNNQEVRSCCTLKELTKNKIMFHLEGTDINEIRSPMTRSSLPTRPTAVLESLLSWRFPSLRYFCIGTFLSGPFFGTFWGLFITFNQGLEIWNFLFSGLSFQKSHIPLLSCLFAQVLTLFKKLELGDVTREMSSSEVGLRVFKVYHVFQDFLGSIKDVNMKEIIAKESLEYQVTSPRTILGMSSQT